MSQKIFFTGFKGGCGVSFCCFGVGLALARSGERTLVLDGDCRCGSGLMTGGILYPPVYTLADYERGACRAKQTVITHPKHSNLCYASAEGLRERAFAENAVRDLDGLFDYILLDNIAGKICDRAMIISEPYAPSVKCADKCRSYLFDGGIKTVELIVNKINGGLILNGDIMTAREIAAVLNMPLAAAIPEDLTLASGKIKESTGAAFKAAAKYITGEKSSAYNVFKGYTGVGGYLKRKLRERI